MTTYTATLLEDWFPTYRYYGAVFTIDPPWYGISYLHVHWTPSSGLRFCKREAATLYKEASSEAVSPDLIGPCLLEFGEQIAAQWAPAAQALRKP